MKMMKFVVLYSAALLVYYYARTELWLTRRFA
jgi:hypothetical protein